MKKELTFSSKFDTSEFDASIERMQKKLKELASSPEIMRAQSQTAQRLQGMGMGGIMSQPGQEAYSRATQQGRRELEQSIKNEARIQEQLGKEIVKRTALAKTLKDQQKETVSGSKEELAIKEKISKLEENTARQREAYKQRDDVLNQMMDTRNSGRLGRPETGPRSGTSGNSGGGFTPTPANIGSVVAAMGGIAGVVTAVAAGTERLAGFPTRIEQARGSAIANTTGRDLSDIYGGRAGFEGQWMTERSQASGLAAEKAKWNRRTDKAMGWGGVGLIGAGLATGAASLAGIPLTAGGSALGLGAAGSMIAGGAGLLYNDRNRKSLAGGAQYDQLIAAQQSEDRLRAYEALKNQNPEKKAVLGKFEGEYQSNLNAQRMLGLSDQGMFGEGGFQNRAAKAGFRPEDAARMSQNIIGAGGSSRMGRNAEFGLQMERTGLTNSGQILGSLSGSIQSTEATKRATISIMSEAFKIGLDNTDFAEENRRFTQSAAAIIGRSGATNEEDQDRLVKSLSMFQGERTNAGVQAAGGAYERSQERGSQVGGRRGAIRFSEARKNPILSKFSTEDLGELLAARPEDLRSDSAFLQSYAIQANTTPEKILEALGKSTKEARFLVPGRKKKAEGLVKDLSQYMKDNNIGYSEMAEKSRLGRGAKGGLPDQQLKEYGQLQRLVSEEESGGFQTANIEAQAGELFSDVGVSRKQGDKGAAKAALGQVGGRIGDVMNATNAAGMDEARKAFVDLTPEIRKAIGAIGAFTDAAVSDAAKMNQNAGRRTDLTRGDALNRDITGPNLQPQSNKPKGL